MQALKMALRAFCAVWRCFCALCPYVARRLLLCCCSAFLGICCGFAAGGPCAVSAAIPPGGSSVAAASILGVSGRGLLCWVSAAAPHLLRVACSVFGSLRAAFRRSLRPWVSVRRAADDRGADSVRTLCDAGHTKRLQIKKWGCFLKIAATDFFANFSATKFWRCIIKLNISMPKLKWLK